jgi:hypothetical protein
MGVLFFKLNSFFNAYKKRDLDLEDEEISRRFLFNRIGNDLF